jgi:folate-binding protein YgfZ
MDYWNDWSRMNLLELHQNLGARFTTVNGVQAVADYGDKITEHAALFQTAGMLDLSFRSRLCLTGSDRVRFLHGQVTNDVKRLKMGQGCYAALVTAKGRMESDLNIYCLSDELLLDFEPGLDQRVSQRLERYIVADDVQVLEVSSAYGLLSIQGPQSEAVIRNLGIFEEVPANQFDFSKLLDSVLGELYLVNHARLGTVGYDLFVPLDSLRLVADKILAALHTGGGCPCGWEAFEIARIESGIPRFGVDMDETNFPQECGIEDAAVSYTKGCYIGQEVLNRIHTMGHVNRSLCGLRLSDDLKALPPRGSRLLLEGKEVGCTTSTAASLALQVNIALGLIRRQASRVGTELLLRTDDGERHALVVSLPIVQTR